MEDTICEQCRHKYICELYGDNKTVCPQFSKEG